MGKCFYCSQPVKLSSNDIMHPSCRMHYLRKTAKALKKTRPEEYPEITIFVKSVATKTKICRDCLRPVSEENAKEINELIDSHKIVEKSRGTCFSCIGEKSRKAAISGEEQFHARPEI